MREPDIPPEIRDLLRAYIDTYEKLDALLLLRRRQVQLELEEVANALELSQRAAREVLSQLVAAELVAEDHGRFRFRPRLAEQRTAVDGLARLFEDDPVRIVQWMSRQAFDRLHDSAASAFAEAVLTDKKKGK